MRFTITSILLAAATSVTAQAVSGTPYGFATGVTGGGAGNAVAPSSVEELAEWLEDDTERVILIDKEYDFTGTTATDAGCDRKSCSASNGGQLYLGDLSCGGSDNVAVSSITYDVAGTEPLLVGSNKSIVGSGGKAVLKGKGLRLKKGSSNVIIQGIEFTDMNPGIVWGGDALDFQGENDGVWVDHCKFSLIGRMFIVSHYDPSRITISNSIFDGVTTTSASCNGNHYWTMMFYGDGDRVTLDRNHFHDVAGRAPKLGDGKGKGTFQATNNYFSNMKGHAFDAWPGVSLLLEGNAFESVQIPITDQGASVSTVYTTPDESAASACESVIGRACAINSIDSSSGKWPSLADSGALSAWSSLKEFLVEPVAASEVASLVGGGAGPANVGSGSGSSSGAAPVVAEPSTVEETPAAATTAASEETVETPETPEVPQASEQTPETTEPEQTQDTTEETEEVVEEDAEEEIDDDTEYCPEDGTGENVEESSGSDTTTPTPESSSSSEEVQQYGQCGGSNYTGPTKCVAGTSCVVSNPYYSQCISSASRRAARGLRIRI